MTSNFILPATDQEIKIHYNIDDKIVRINAENQQLPIIWLDDSNSTKAPVSDKNKTVQSTLDIPKAIFKIIDSDTGTNTNHKTQIPKSYLQYTGKEEKSDRDVEYDLDREDLEWLQRKNEARKAQGLQPIEESAFEKAIDMLEKESYFQSGHSNSNGLIPFIDFNDTDAPCCVCNDAEDSNGNQIIFCDMCNIAVHQECYGVPYIPEGQWLCRRCQFSPSATVQCVLCPFTTGAFKQTTDGRWVHVMCAIWLNEVHFANIVFLEPVENVDHCLKRRQKLTCNICKTKVGACLQCCRRTCLRSFHVTCAYHAGMQMEVKEIRNKKNPETVDINRFVCCLQHSRDGPKNGESKAAWDRRIKQKISDARKKLTADAKHTRNTVPIPVISSAKINEIAERLKIENFSDISKYWSMKRKLRFGVPLIRRLQVYHGHQRPVVGKALDGNLPIPSSSRTPSRQSQITSLQKSNSDPLQQYSILRRQLERVRLLCELNKKREKTKLELIEGSEEIFTRIKPLSVILNETLEKLIEKDHEKVFAQPVSEEEVPGYHRIITKPMDFRKMRQRMQKGNYKSVADLRVDFTLMMDNCLKFNRDNRYFYEYAQRIKPIGLSVIKSAERAQAKTEEVLPLIGQSLAKWNTLSPQTLDKLKAELRTQDNDEKKPTTSKNMTAENAEKQLKTQTNRKKSICGNKSSALNTTAVIQESKPPIKRKSSMKQNEESSKIKKRRSAIVLSTSKEPVEQQNVSTETQLETPNKKETIEPQNLLAEKSASSRRASTSRKRKLCTVDTQNSHPPQLPAEISPSENIAVSPIKEPASSSRRQTPLRPHASMAHEDLIKADLKWTRPSQNLRRSTTIAQTNLLNQTMKKEPKEEKKSAQRINSTARGVEKQNYMNAYLTEASSTAEDSDAARSPYIGALSSMEEEADEEHLPIPTPFRESPKKGRQKCNGSGQISGQHMSSEFEHEDIVLAQLDDGQEMPGHVFDLRMPLEYKTDEGLESLKKEAFDTRPKYGKHTLVILFDKEDTRKWFPNEKLRRYVPQRNVPQSRSMKSSEVDEAFARAHEYFENFPKHEHLD